MIEMEKVPRKCSAARSVNFAVQMRDREGNIGSRGGGEMQEVGLCESLVTPLHLASRTLLP